MPGHDEILTISEVAELLKIAEKTVYGLAQRGDIPAFKVGGQWRFSRGAIHSWIEERTRSAQQPGRVEETYASEDRGTASPSDAAKTPTRRRR